MIFGKNVPGLEKEIRKFAEATGASRFEMKGQVADLGALLEPLSANKKAAGDMSVQMVRLASDLGSFNNVPTADALTAIRAGLVGEAEPLRRFGVLLNEATVSAEGLRLGLVKKGETLTEQEKVQARASLIMQQTTLAQGDAERTADSYANQMKRLKNQLSDTATEMGQALLPAAIKVVTAFNAHWPAIERVARQVFSAIGQAWQGTLRPALAAIIERVRDVAESAREHWGTIKDAAAQAMDYYRGTLQPTISAVLGHLRRLWELFGDDVQAVMRTLLSVIGNGLRAAKAVVEGVMAVLRGDWKKAWESLRTAVAEVLGGMKTLIVGLGGALVSTLREIGTQMIEGLAAGIKGAGEKVKDAVTSVVNVSGIDVARGLLGIRSPSRVFEGIGKDMMDGWMLGIVNNRRKITDALIETARRATEEARGRAQAAFGKLQSMASFAFGRRQGGALTPTEALMADVEARRAEEARTRAVEEAQAALAALRGDPEATAESVRAAERTLVDAQYEVWRAGAQRQADTERRELEERQMREQSAFDLRLSTLQAHIDAGHLTAKQAQAQLRDILHDFGIDAQAAGEHVGVSFMEGLLAMIPAVAAAAAALRGAATAQGALEQGKARQDAEALRIANAKKDAGKKGGSGKGDPGSGVSVSGGDLIGLGKQLLGQGFQVGEHPAFGGVDPVHTANSYHYKGRALDINWPGGGSAELARLQALFSALRARGGWAELLLEDAGRSNQHLHVALAEGALVKGGRGGVTARIGEAAHDELVLPLKRGMGGIGETHVHLHFPGGVAVGRAEQIVDALLPALRVELDKIKRQNVTTGL